MQTIPPFKTKTSIPSQKKLWIFMTIKGDVCNKARLLNPSTIPFLPFCPGLMLKQSLMHVCPNTSLQIKAWLGYVKLKGLIEWPHPIQNVLLCICFWQGLMGYITQWNRGVLQHRHSYSNTAPVLETSCASWAQRMVRFEQLVSSKWRYTY